MRKINFRKYFILNWKRTLIVIIVGLISILIHNLIYILTNYVLGKPFSEFFFWLIAIVGVPLYFLIAILYTLHLKLEKRR
jgi:lipopolysaccharide export LptBFGC system permease protein LptF